MTIVNYKGWRIKVMPEHLASGEWVPAAHAGKPGKLADDVVPMKKLTFASPQLAEENAFEQAKRWIDSKEEG